MQVNQLLWIYEISNDVIIEKFKEYEIDHRLKNNPNSFSSGEKKKLALLFSELANPKLLFLDEPEANLDPTSRLKLYQKLYEFKSSGMAVFVSTHLINEIKGYVDMGYIYHTRKNCMKWKNWKPWTISIFIF